MRVIITEKQLRNAVKKSINEGIGGDILNKILSWGKDKLEKIEKLFDDPSKADLLDDNPDHLFDTLEGIDDPISQDDTTSTEWHKNVEAVQMGLSLLGYNLPSYGVDGMFGEETASAVEKFKQDNSVLNESTYSMPVPSTKITSRFGEKRSYETHPGIDIAVRSGTSVKSPADGVVKVASFAGGQCGGTVIIKHADGLQSGMCHLKQIDVKAGDNVTSGQQVGLSGGAIGDKGAGNSTGPHLHLTVRRNGSLVDPESLIGSAVSSDGNIGTVGSVITVEMVKKMISKLRSEGITQEDLRKLIDPAKVTGGSDNFTDLNLTTADGYGDYVKICNNYITSRNPSSPITGKMLADGAKMAFERYQKYVPPELALAQITLEGGLGNDPKSVPIRTKNPFNVGNTGSAEKTLGSFQEGVNLYYSLIARKYMVGGKTANDLVRDFKNDQGMAYAESGTYEIGLNKLLKDIRRKSESIYKDNV